MKRIIIAFTFVLLLIMSLTSCGFLGAQNDNVPYIGENGNWWVGNEDTGVQAQGPAGEKGEKGDKGDKGQAGAPGADGAPGMTPSISIIDGYWYINGENTGVIARGRDGVDATMCESHDFEEFVILEHNFDQDGLMLLICNNCGYVDAETLGHTPAVEFDISNIDTSVWTPVEDATSEMCVCETGPIYSTPCVDCGYEILEMGVAAGHVWGESVPAINDTDLCDCEWAPTSVAHCVVCDCFECVNYVVGEALGHSWGEWVILVAPNFSTEGSVIRQCANCAGDDNCTEEVVLPALTDASYSVEVISADEAIYTYVLEDGSTIEILSATPVSE